MKVSFYNRFCHNKLSAQYNYNVKYFDVPRDTISFRQTVKIPPKAIEYLTQQKAVLGAAKPTLYCYEWKKLEGLQNGIKIFDGLNFTQIGYIITNLDSIIVQRGCNNACIHCFAEAQTPFHMKMNHLADKIDFEDYKNLLDGFKELNNRFGYNIFGTQRDNHLALFHDADCSMIFLQDKDGKVYDYADLAKMLHDVTGRGILFDTAGWNLNDKKTQKRMEDLVKKITSGNDYDFIKFYISVNPFHSIYNKSVELFLKKDYEKAKRLREIYTDRMANVIFTFSPLINKTHSINKPQIEFIFRALFDQTKLEGYQRHNLESLRFEIFDKLEKMYKADLLSENPKIVKSEEQLEKYHSYFYDHFLYNRIEAVNLCNKKLLDKLNGIPAAERNIAQKYSFNSAIEGLYFDAGKIDVNGKFYMSNYVETYLTDIVLGYKNKGKPTAPMAPNLRREIITKEIIEESWGQT